MNMEMSRSDLSWRPLFLVTFLVAYLYVFNEWLFAITKPYFLNDLSLIRQLQILLTIGALLPELANAFSAINADSAS